MTETDIHPESRVCLVVGVFTVKAIKLKQNKRGIKMISTLFFHQRTQIIVIFVSAISAITSHYQAPDFL